MLSTLSQMSTQEADGCKNWADTSMQALKAYYQQLRAAQYNFNEALDTLVTLTDKSQKTGPSEQQKKLLELSNKPTLALYMGFPEHFLPSEVKKSETSAFLPPPRKGANPGPPRGSKNQFPNQESEGTNQGSRAPPSRGGTPMHKRSRKYWNY